MKPNSDTSISQAVKMLHLRLFPEVYDFVSDSISEAIDRRNGQNPMDTRHQQSVSERRAKLGVSTDADAYATLMWVTKQIECGELENLQDLADEFDKNG